ncbi:MAG TPA: hypothetical protein VFA90_12260 [Terriglobales bacterium]|nr:hypothetical protein [Terriglobales bacterium]
MSSLSWNAADITSSPFLPAQTPDKKTHILNHISGSKILMDVRPASRLEVRPRPEMISTGIAELDALTGGFPRGCLSEICGSGSSGKSSVLLATIAAASRRGESCVLIDASDSFDPESGAAARINFGKLLWVRCGKKLSAINPQPSGKSSLVVGHWLLANQSCADFEADDQSPTTKDVVARDARRTTHDDFTQTRSERRLDQVLKTTDLVLQSGGFGLVALDLAGIPQKFVRRIPLASWFRFQRAVEHTKTALLVVSEFPCAQTCVSVTLKLSPVSRKPSEKNSLSQNSNSLGCPTLPPLFGKRREDFSKPTHARLLEGMQIEAELARTRLERKPMQSVKANFATRAVRAG